MFENPGCLECVSLLISILSDGRPEGEHRGRDPLGARPVPEDGLACQALHERDRTYNVIGGNWSSRATIVKCNATTKGVLLWLGIITLRAVCPFGFLYSKIPRRVSMENINSLGFEGILTDALWTFANRDSYFQCSPLFPPLRPLEWSQKNQPDSGLFTICPDQGREHIATGRHQ